MEVESARSPTKKISPITLACGASSGCPALSGICPSKATSFSLTTWRARNTSVPQSNSTHTNEKPCEEVERTRRTPVAPFMAVSIG